MDYANDWKADLVKDLPNLNHVNPLVINEQALIASTSEDIYVHLTH